MKLQLLFPICVLVERKIVSICNEIVNKFKTNLLTVGKDYSLINQVDKRINIKFNSSKMSYSFFKFLFFFINIKILMLFLF